MIASLSIRLHGFAAHVLVAQYCLFLKDNTEGYDLMLASSNLAEVKAPGRPAKKLHCLQNTTKKDEANVIEAIKKNPTRLCGVQVVKKYEVGQKLMLLYGKVSGISPHQRVKNDFMYHIRFDDNSNEFWNIPQILKNKVK